MGKLYVLTICIVLSLLLCSCKEEVVKVESTGELKQEPIDNVSWQSIVKQRLPAFGHRNWIVIADAAYPQQSNAGIETVVTGAKQLEVVEFILSAIDSSEHVYPMVMLDKELKYLTEESAPGVMGYRKGLDSILSNQPRKELPHEDIILRLDQGAELFNVLLLKTEMTIPYTSVFIALECGYWDADRQKELRDKVKGN